MRERRLPKLGLLGLITDGYEPNFPGITARQEAFAREIIAELSDVAEIYFPLPSSLVRSVDLMTVSMNAPRTPCSSRVLMPTMVLPPGEHT